MELLAQPWLIHSIALIALFLGSITDLRRREVPDYLSFSLVAVGLALGISASIQTTAIWPFVWSLSGLLAGYFIGALMFYTGQWGGGDAKILMGLGAVIGLDISFLWTSSTTIPFFALLIGAILFMGGIYGLVYIAGIIISQRKKFATHFKILCRQPQHHNTRKIILLISTTGILLSLFLFQTPFNIFVAGICLLFVLFFYVMVATKVVEQHLLTQPTRISKLTPGEWIPQNIFITTNTQHSPITSIKFLVRMSYFPGQQDNRKKQTIFINHKTKQFIREIVFQTYSKRTPIIRLFRHAYLVLAKKKYERYRKKIIFALHLKTKKSFQNYIKKNNLEELEKTLAKKNIFFNSYYVCGPKDLGLTPTQIKELQERKIKTIPVKKGIPFLPAFLLGYIAMLLWSHHFISFLSLL